MPKRRFICTHPDLRKETLNPARSFFHGCVPHPKCSPSDFLRVFNDFPPPPLRIYPARLRVGCGARCGATLPIRYGPGEKTLKKDPKRTIK